MNKVLTVSGINQSIELSTGDIIYQILFSEDLRVTSEVLSRFVNSPPESRPVGNTVSVNNLAIWVKKTPIPYRVGSKWRLTVDADGKMQLASEA